MKARDYQEKAIEAVLSEWQSHASTLVVMPTGTGKTICFAHILQRMAPKRGLVLAHRKELVEQAADKIRKVTGWRVDIEMGENRAGLDCMFGGPQVVVSTIQTQCSGGDGSGRMTRFDPRMFGVIIVDEAHHTPSVSYKRVLNWYVKQNPEIRILGVTATPDRADEEALGQIYETVAYDYEICDAIDDGWLVPVNQQMVYVHELDFSHCRTTAGDLNGGDLAKVMEFESNLQRVASATIEIMQKRRTIVFCASVAHAERMAELFNRYEPGMASWVCGETPSDRRSQILREFDAGRLQVVCNCGVLTEGFDSPNIQLVVMARPTKSRSLYAQMAGRGMRPHSDIANDLNAISSAEGRKEMIAASRKQECMILDFVGNSGRHKLVTSVDILGGKVSDEVLEMARKRAEKTGGRVDEIIRESEEELEKKKLEEASRRANLVAKARWTAKTVDPFDTFGIKPMPERGWDSGRTLTEKQENLLIRQGIDPSTLSYTEGRQLINELFRRWNNNLCTFGQAKILARHGYSTNISKDEATKIITEIAEREGWRK